MRYAILITDSELFSNINSGINVGGIFMKDAMIHIYEEMGVRQEDLIALKFEDLENYHGEKVILPICIHVPISHGNGRIFKCSKDIIPVFLSLSLSSRDLKDYEIECLKKYSPVGCRDSQTYDTVKKYGINAFIMGDIVLTTPGKGYGNKQKSKVILSDVPLFAGNYLPNRIIRDGIYIKQEILCSELPDGYSPIEYAKEIKDIYRYQAGLVITSRFHAAVLAMAYHIPYIVINEAYTFRFSWLKKFGNFYTRENIDSIDFNVKAKDYTSVIHMMETAAIMLLSRGDNKSLPERFVDIMEGLTDIYSYDRWNDVKPIDYYDGAIEHIGRLWNTNTTIYYSFWGINNNAEAIYEYIYCHFPNACLFRVYDERRTVEFHGVKSVSPDLVSDNEFIFVTTFTAKGNAQKLFEKRSISSYYICEREYLSKQAYTVAG